MTLRRSLALTGLMTLITLSLGAGCGDKGGGSSDTGGDGGGTTDAGTTVDAGTTADGGASDGGAGDGGGDGGTPANDPRNGTYDGSFTVRVIVPKGDLLDTCIGTSRINVNLAGKQQLRGNATCHFDGALAKTNKGGHEATISGANGKAQTLSGAFNVALGGGAVVADDWTGSFLPKQKMEGAFNGTVDMGGTTYDYTGDFKATLSPDDTSGGTTSGS